MQEYVFPQHERPIPLVVIVTGLPATGKSSLATYLAQEFKLPLLYKDGIKERLFDTLGWRDRQWSQQLGVVTYAILYDMLEMHLQARTSLIVESNFSAERDSKQFHNLFQRYAAFPYQILCYAEGSLLWQRFKERIDSPERHPGHQEGDSLAEFEPIISKGYQPALTLDAPLSEIDTTVFPSTSDYAKIARQISTYYQEKLSYHL